MLLTELPTYLYHNAELPHRGDGALFHYTKFSSFLKIMEDMTLLPSSFGNLNDMNEGNVSNMNSHRMAFSNLLLGLNLMYSLICLHRAKV